MPYTEEETLLCPDCFGSGWNVDECGLCDRTGKLVKSQATVTKMFRYASEMMANVEHQGVSEKLGIPLGWLNGDYDLTPSENARRILVNAEAMIIMACATGLADQLHEQGAR